MAQRLSLWVSDRTRDDVFWRSAMSGGRSTVIGKNRDGDTASAQAGDLVATHELGNLLVSWFVLECKNFKDFRFTTLIFGGKGDFLPEWEKLIRDCDRTGKYPMMFAKQSRVGELVFSDQEGMDHLMKGATKYVPIRVAFPVHDVYGISMTDFLNEIDYQKLKKHLQDF